MIKEKYKQLLLPRQIGGIYTTNIHRRSVALEKKE